MVLCFALSPTGQHLCTARQGHRPGHVATTAVGFRDSLAIKVAAVWFDNEDRNDNEETS